MNGPLTAAVGLLAIAELATWAPNYLTWPWWADHDVFATAAFGWQRGALPYRDLLGNNFPATTYVFWALGRLFGWGYTPAFWAFDVVLVGALGGMLLVWSRRQFGRALPAAVGYVTFLGHYLNLDYSQAAQRDWHAPFFAVVGLLVAQSWPGRGGRIGSAILLATGLAFRPQVVVFVPAFIVAIWAAGQGPRRGVLAVLSWSLVIAATTVLWFAPVIGAGLLDDFLRGVRLASYGGRYNQVTLGSFGRAMLVQLLNLKVLATIAAVALLGQQTGPSGRRAARVWVVALLAVFLYRPLSPNPLHAYLAHPLMLTWAVTVAVLVELVVGSDERATSRLAVVLLVLGLGASAKPRFCNPVGSLEALGWLKRGEDPLPCPTGYTTNPESKSAGAYEWDDYRRTLAYLRGLPPETRVANVLRHVPALTGPAARLPAFPAESVAWLLIVNGQDQPRFAEALRQAPDSVVVWVPAEAEEFPLDRLDPLIGVVRNDYEPAERFGIIEVWRLKSGRDFPGRRRPIDLEGRGRDAATGRLDGSRDSDVN